MRRLDWYVGGTVLRAILIVLMVLLALDAVSDLLEQTGDLSADYNLGAALLYVLLKIPGSAVDYLGFAALIGCLMGVGGLSNNSELAVMRAAGVSGLQIFRMVLKPALLIILAGVLVAEYVAPGLEQIAQARKDLLRGSTSQQQAEGTWIRDEDEYVHINAVYPNGVLYGVSRFRVSGGELDAISFSQTVLWDGSRWLEGNIRATEFGGSYTSAEDISSRTWRTQLSPEIIAMASLGPEQLSMRDLQTYAEYLGYESRQAGAYRVAFWNRMLQPVAVAALVLVGFSFVFGSNRSVPMSQRIFAGVIVAVVFKLAQDILGPASTIWGFSPAVAVAIPIGLTLLLGLLLLRRQG